MIYEHRHSTFENMHLNHRHPIQENGYPYGGGDWDWRGTQGALSEPIKSYFFQEKRFWGKYGEISF